MALQYLPILLFIFIGCLVGIGPLVLGLLVGRNKPNSEKNSAFECGFAAFKDARMQFDVRFYLVAILFIIFDLELAFLLPWAVVIEDVGWSAFIAVLCFLTMLAVGFIYEWRKGALEWE